LWRGENSWSSPVLFKTSWYILSSHSSCSWEAPPAYSPYFPSSSFSSICWWFTMKSSIYFTWASVSTSVSFNIFYVAWLRDSWSSWMLLLFVLSSVNSVVENPAFWKYVPFVETHALQHQQKMWFPCWLTKITRGDSSSSTLYTL
jgi:hypothetical protein